jgi:undecaprenyl-diphosphatase
MRREALYVLLAIGGGLLVSLALKAGVQRPQPELISHGARVYRASFPSGHSMLSAIVYLTGGALLALAREGRAARPYLIDCALVAALLVGISRAYLGVGWPTDVLAGWADGATWAALCWLIAQGLRIRGHLGQPDSPGSVSTDPGG